MAIRKGWGRQAFAAAAFFCLLPAGPALGQTDSALLPLQDFDPVNLVRLGPQEGELYDTYTIGDGSQSLTARRWITPFEMNRFETSYSLWYEVRVQAEKAGYTFANPGQEGSQGKRAARPSRLNRAQPDRKSVV